MVQVVEKTGQLDCGGILFNIDPESIGDELVDEFLDKIDEIISKKE